MKKSLFLLTMLSVTVIALGYAYAHSSYTGRTMKSGTQGCGNCHAKLSTAVQVSITGPETLAAGARGTYQVTISGGSGSSVCVDIAASAGTLTPADGNTKASNGELITNGVKRYSGGSYTYSFSLTAPSTPQSVTLYATGLSTMQAFNFAPNKIVTVTSGTTGLESSIPALPVEIELSPNFPNPFNPSTTITYTLPEKASVHLAVYDAAGRQLAVLWDGVRAQGGYFASWDASEFPSGTYYYRLSAMTADGRAASRTRKMLLEK